MVEHLIYILPCIVCLIWFASFALKVKNVRQRLFMWIQALSAFHFATYALYITPHDDYFVMVIMNSINIPLCLVMFPMVVMFMHMHHAQVRLSPWHLLFLLPAVIMGTIVNVFHYIIGVDNAARMVEYHDCGIVVPEFDSQLHHLHDVVVYDLFGICSLVFLCVIIAECLIVLFKDGYKLGDAARFFFKGHRTTPSRALAMLYLVQIALLLPLVVMGRPFMMSVPVLGGVSMVLLSVVKHCMCHVEYYSDTEKTMSLYELSHIRSVPLSLTDAGDECNDEEKMSSGKLDLVADGFRHIMDGERLYLDEDLTLSAVADRLGVGRTTLSTMINQRYGVTFRELVNRYRIDAVKNYMMQHPTATQEAVASECGFKNAPSLNRKFKEIEGETPLMWLTRNYKQHK